MYSSSDDDDTSLSSIEQYDYDSDDESDNPGLFPSMKPVLETNSQSLRSAHSNPYIKEISDSRELFIRQIKTAQKAYNEFFELGLFHLFIARSFIACVQSWTNLKRMVAKGKKKVSYSEICAFVSLEIARGLIGLNSIKEYWSNKMFRGHPDFKNAKKKSGVRKPKKKPQPKPKKSKPVVQNETNDSSHESDEDATTNKKTRKKKWKKRPKKDMPKYKNKDLVFKRSGFGFQEGRRAHGDYR